MKNIIVAIIIVLIIISSIHKILQEKKKGAKCIGCGQSFKESGSCYRKKCINKEP